MLCFKPCLRPKSLSMSYSFGLFSTKGGLAKQGGREGIRPPEYKKSCGGDSSLPPQDLTLMGKQTALVPLPEMKTTLGGGRLGFAGCGSLAWWANSQSLAKRLCLLATHQW
ncbi:hypothetical protein SAMN02745203_01738 [Porphyromonas crevioricanis]|nr:hypothetical protein SAMN02745203_01738 [Porphyromonas crevioricanis]